MKFVCEVHQLSQEWAQLGTVSRLVVTKNGDRTVSSYGLQGGVMREGKRSNCVMQKMCAVNRSKG